jgi:hypothetical protein
MTDGGIWKPRDLPVLPPLTEGVDRPDDVEVEAATADGALEEPALDVVVVDEVEFASVVLDDDGEVLEVVEIAEVVEFVEVAVDDVGDIELDDIDADDVAPPGGQLERAPGLPEVFDAPAAAPAVAASSAPEPAITPDVLELELRAVDAALARLDSGDYGRCGVCNLVLDDAVMAADPTVAVCPAHVGLRPALAG